MRIQSISSLPIYKARIGWRRLALRVRGSDFLQAIVLGSLISLGLWALLIGILVL